MRAGRMDRQITIEKPNGTLSGFGEPIDEWSVLAAVWADVQPQSGREFMAGGGEQATSNMIFVIHYRADLNRNMRIVYEGETYDIKAIREIGRRAGMEIAVQASVI